MKEKIRDMKVWHIIILAMIIVLGFGIRFYDLTDPPLDFHPARQLHSAMIARGEFAQLDSSYYPAEENALIAAQWASEYRIEPPIIEFLVSRLFWILGTDDLWIARIISIVFWMIGAIGIFLLARELSSERGALFASLFYSILPYGVISSRSFQPDPLMITLMIFSFWTFLRWGKSKSWQYALWAGILGGAAIFVKQVAVFFIAAAGIGTVLTHFNVRKILREGQIWLVAVLCTLPTLIYNLYGVFIDGSLAGQYSMRFFPELLLDVGFYLRWLGLIQVVIPIELVFLSLAGVLILTKKTKRLFLFSLFSGYLLLGLVLSHHISTHDYYQMALIPLVAVGLAPLFEWILKGLEKQLSGKWFVSAVLLICIAGTSLSLYESYNLLKKKDYRDRPDQWAQLVEKMGGEYAVSIGLYDDYGASQIYYGYNYPLVFPSLGDIQFSQIAENESVEASIRERMQNREFFLVANFDEYNRQPDLKAYLETYATLIDSGDWFLLYDMREAR